MIHIFSSSADTQPHSRRVPTQLQQFLVGFNAIMIYTHICKQFRFKNNKINNKNPIQIIQKLIMLLAWNNIIPTVAQFFSYHQQNPQTFPVSGNAA